MGHMGCREVSCSSSPHGAQCAPSPSPSSPNATLIYYVQDLPIKLFSNLLPSLLCSVGTSIPDSLHVRLC